jgi:hypothetical protein
MRPLPTDAAVCIEAAEHLLEAAGRDVSENMRILTGESKTDLLLAALTNAVMALAITQLRDEP